MSDRIITQAELAKIVPFSRATLWRLQRMGNFPKRRQISPGRVGWLASEIEAFLAGLPQAKSLEPSASN